MNLEFINNLRWLDTKSIQVPLLLQLLSKICQGILRWEKDIPDSFWMQGTRHQMAWHFSFVPIPFEVHLSVILIQVCQRDQCWKFRKFMLVACNIIRVHIGDIPRISRYFICKIIGNLKFREQYIIQDYIQDRYNITP